MWVVTDALVMSSMEERAIEQTFTLRWSPHAKLLNIGITWALHRHVGWDTSKQSSCGRGTVSHYEVFFPNAQRWGKCKNTKLHRNLDTWSLLRWMLVASHMGSDDTCSVLKCMLHVWHMLSPEQPGIVSDFIRLLCVWEPSISRSSTVVEKGEHTGSQTEGKGHLLLTKWCLNQSLQN